MCGQEIDLHSSRGAGLQGKMAGMVGSRRVVESGGVGSVGGRPQLFKKLPLA